MFALRWITGWLAKLFPNFFKQLNGWLIAFIAPLVAPFFAFLTSFFRKVALYGLIVTAIGVAIITFSGLLSNSVEAILNLAAPEVIDFGRIFLPSNLSYAVTILVFSRLQSLIFMWVHRLTERFIHT